MDDPRKHAESRRKYRQKLGSYAANKGYRLRNPDKYRAHQSVSKAIALGRLIRPNECSKCHRTCKPEAHHEDYSKSLEVIWLCRPCHLALDGKIPRIPVKGDPVEELERLSGERT